MDQDREAHQVSRPAVDRPDQPAERHVADEVLHALVRGLLADLVVHQEQDSRHDLDDEEEERDAAEVVPDGRVRADRHLLVAQELDETGDLESLVERVPERGRGAVVGEAGRRGRAHARASRSRDRDRLPSGRRPRRRPRAAGAAGPERTRPSRENFPLWQAHQMRASAATNWTVHPSCVHFAENAAQLLVLLLQDDDPFRADPGDEGAHGRELLLLGVRQRDLVRRRRRPGAASGTGGSDRRPPRPRPRGCCPEGRRSSAAARAACRRRPDRRSSLTGPPVFRAESSGRLGPRRIRSGREIGGDAWTEETSSSRCFAGSTSQPASSGSASSGSSTGSIRISCRRWTRRRRRRSSRS